MVNCVRKIYPIKSNKTVRRREKYIERWTHKTEGELVKTNRGFFLDGKHISVFSANMWLSQNKHTSEIAPIYREPARFNRTEETQDQIDRVSRAKKRAADKTVSHFIKATTMQESYQAKWPDV